MSPGEAGYTGRVKLLDGEVFRLLAREAASSPRKRGHFNLHPDHGDPVQRLCLAAGTSSYFRPHRHREGGTWELFIALRGGAAILTFDGEGTVLERVEIRAGGEVPGAEIPPGAWHTLAVLEEGSLLFEVKPGPYLPAEDKDFAPWAPAEGSPAGEVFGGWLRAARPGNRPPR